MPRDIAENELELPVAPHEEPLAVDVRGLRVSIQRRGGGTVLLDDVSFAVPVGGALAIVGESGAGKSVSVRSVLGLLDSRRFEVSGRVALDGVDLATLPPRKRAQFVAGKSSIVFQNPERSLNPSMRVGWQIAEAMYKSRETADRVSKGEAKDRSVQLMREVGIAEPEERFFAYPHQLSGGMKQRVAIAIALSSRSNILFCDEPTSSLDVTTQALIMDLLDNLRARFRLSIVFITHDLALAASRVDDIVVMYQGRVVEKIGASRLISEAAMPYTQALLKSIPGVDGKLPEAIPTLVRENQREAVGCAFYQLCPRAEAICHETTPELIEIGQQHTCRCWFPGPVPTADP